MSDNENLPAVREEEPSALMAPGVPWQRKKVRIATTLEPAETLRVINQTEQLENIGEKPIVVTDVVAHMVSIVDAQTAEVSERWRTVLVCKDKKAYAAVSEGVLDSIGQLAELYGPPPWKDGLKVKLVIVHTRRGFRTFRLVPA